jgi:ribonuclease III
MNDETDRAKVLRHLAARLQIDVNNLSLLDQALTHASTAAEGPGTVADYEALEFLGDAALSLAVAHHLFVRCPDRTPGEYSRMRAGLVNRRILARIAAEIDIAPAIRLGKGEEQAGGRHRASLLADCLESLIGVVYLEMGWEATQAFVERILKKELDDTTTNGVVWDYKSRLQHYCQSERLDLPSFEVVRSEGPDHFKEFEVEVSVRGKAAGRGTGRSKKEAEQNAARAALERENQVD